MKTRRNVLPGHHERPHRMMAPTHWRPFVAGAPHDRFRHAGVLRLNPAVWVDEPANAAEAAPTALPAPLTI